MDKGCKKIILGLGGSATNDGGCGCAAALGVKVLDREGREFLPTGQRLTEIKCIDVSGLDRRIGKLELKLMCDVENLLCGPKGAARVFAPQKGADPQMVELLDRGLVHLAGCIEAATGICVTGLKGGGAAGGMGAGCAALLGGKLEKGIELILDAVGFDKLTENSDLVISGEGSIDSQTLSGKVVMGVARRIAGKNIPLIALGGKLGDGIDVLYSTGLTAAFGCNRQGLPFKELKHRCRADLEHTAEDIIRLIKAIENRFN